MAFEPPPVVLASKMDSLKRPHDGDGSQAAPDKRPRTDSSAAPSLLPPRFGLVPAQLRQLQLQLQLRPRRQRPRRPARPPPQRRRPTMAAPRGWPRPASSSIGDITKRLQAAVQGGLVAQGVVR